MTTLIDTPEISVEPFHLISGQTGNEVEALIPIMWCVQPSTAKWFVDNNVLDPHFLITVLHDAGESVENYRFTEMDRYVVPLSQGIEYVRFRRSGKNIVRATVVWMDGSTGRTLRGVFKKTDSNGDWNKRVVDSDGNIDLGNAFTVWSDDEFTNTQADRHQWNHVTSMTFTVASDTFGKPSADWERLYFGKFSKKPVDECARRGRRILLWPILPIFVALSTAFKSLVVFVCSIIGFRYIGYSSIWHPFSGTLSQVVTDIDPKHEGLFWFHEGRDDKGRHDAFLRSPFFWPLNPMTMLALWGILAWIAETQHHTSTPHHFVHIFKLAWWESLLWSVGIHLGIITVAILGTIIVSFVIWLFLQALPEGRRKKITDWWEAKMTEWDMKSKNRRISSLADDLGTMSCEQIPSEVGLGAIPRQRRNMHLRVQSLKIRRVGKRTVCRPFEQ